MSKTVAARGLIVALAFSTLTACADAGPEEEDLASEDELSVSEDELRFSRRHPHFPRWWPWWWWRHQPSVDAGRDSGIVSDSGVPTDSGAPADSGTPEVDGGIPEVDSGTPEVDSGTPEIDSGTPEVDSGTPEVDSGTPEVDSGTPEVDSGTPEVDSGTPEVDSGTPEVDSGTPEVDSGTPEVDSGTPEVDSGTPEVDSGTPEVDSGVVDSGTPSTLFSEGCMACANTNCNPNPFSGQNLVTDCTDSICREIVQCAVETDCALNADNGIDPGSISRCYCGAVTPDVCDQGSYVPNGECQDLFEEGVGTTTKSDVILRLTDATYSGADAFLLLQCVAEFWPGRVR